ncbi:MAG: type II toxin-antitoxin system HicA family toxin [Methanoregula sp.]
MEFNGWEILGKIRKVIKIIESDGWYLKRVSGDHRQYPMR